MSLIVAIAFLIANNRTWLGWELCGGLSQDGGGTKSAKEIPEPDPLLKTGRITPTFSHIYLTVQWTITFHEI